MENIWAERRLIFVPHGSGERSFLFVRIGRPYTEPGKAWRVNLEIQQGAEEALRTHAGGDDSMQALQTALAAIPGLLLTWRERGTLVWEGSIGTGFGD
ncbi:DUF6968 family protein [Sorangium cellulosum]|uniref:DUF6968 domain-containing protein n=1 Tax=Sorangium cellulosum TaxID=56 RepID=A0A150QJ40_SORCE|nr:hypothetical protein [Sorangium cellulosum]KYF67943.1 hypothetical protein BE15_45045 [Sorangium cellulosum]